MTADAGFTGPGSMLSIAPEDHRLTCEDGTRSGCYSAASADSTSLPPRRSSGRGIEMTL
jgi:hypothetical protein